MIDVENQVFTELKTRLTTQVSNIKVDSVFQNTPSSFPFVSCEMIDNSKNLSTADMCGKENGADTTFEVHIYSKSQYKKTEAKEISQIVDEYFNSIGFWRNSYTPFQANETFRIVLRYSAVVSKNHITYRR